MASLRLQTKRIYLASCKAALMQKRFNDPGYMKHISVIQLANQKTITEL
jgi:hypothetical protein